jgi:hypothetical protein
VPRDSISRAVPESTQRTLWVWVRPDSHAGKEDSHGGWPGAPADAWARVWEAWLVVCHDRHALNSWAEHWSRGQDWASGLASHPDQLSEP